MNTTLISTSLELNTFGDTTCIDVVETRVVATIQIDEDDIAALYEQVKKQQAEVRENPPDAPIRIHGQSYWLFGKDIEALRADLKDYIEAGI